MAVPRRNWSRCLLRLIFAVSIPLAVLADSEPAAVEGSLRLAGGNDTAGRVEVFLGDEWGTVCDNSWDMVDAHVACRQLGFVHAYSSPPYAFFGEGPGRIRMVNVSCTGSETRLSDCIHTSSPSINCYHWEVVSVVCDPGTGEFQWTEAVYGCIRENNVGTTAFVGTIQECQQRCKDETSFVCLSVDYRMADGECLMSNVSSDTVDPPSDYTQPCFVQPTNYQYSERLDVRRALDRSDNDGICEEIAVAQCKGMSYDMTQFPNVLGQQTQTEVEESFEYVFSSMMDLGCPAEFFQYMCHLYVPPCESSGVPRTPCKEFCESGVVVCFEIAVSRGIDLPVDTASACGSLPLASTGTCFNGISSTSTSQDGGGDEMAPTDTTCENIVVSDCKNMPYSETQFPNQIGDQSQADVEETYGYIFTVMREVGCPVEFFQYMCLLFVPPCGSADVPRVPCKELCLAGVGGCLENAGSQGFDIPFNTSACEGLPSADSGICLGRTSPRPTQEPTEQPEPTEPLGPAVRLSDGGENYGRVEVFYGGKWASVCDDSWDFLDAEILCRELGFPGASSEPRGSRFFGADDSVARIRVDCTGGETSLSDCPTRDAPVWSCLSGTDASAICLLPDGTTGVPEYGHVRLVGGNETAGTVEVYTRSNVSEPGATWPQWGTVCDDEWDISDAEVVCRQLGFPGALNAPGGGFFGKGNGVPLISNTTCSGREENLLGCSSGSPSCPREKVAGVVCSPSTAPPGGSTIRLVGGDANSGRVELYFGRHWSTICDIDWDMTDATVTCRALGFLGAVSIQKGAYYGEGVGPDITDHLWCYGSEPSPLRCQRALSGGCDHSQDAGVVCSHGDGPRSPRARVRDDGRCGGDWLAANGEVAECDPTGDFPCCSASHRCGNHHACRCYGCFDFSIEYGSVRLVGGPNDTAGIVEVYVGDSDGSRPRWGTVCDDDWDAFDAAVVCRQLGWPGVINAPRGAFFGPTDIFSSPSYIRAPLMSDVACVGIEENITSCSSGTPRCEREEVASVVCQPPERSGAGSIRLVDGPDDHSGRVEVFDRGLWGTVCDASWDMNDGHVLCRQLGYVGALSVQRGAYYGEGTGPINIDHLRCGLHHRGSIWTCTRSSRGGQCTHSQDAGVVCDIGHVDGDTDTCEEMVIDSCKFMPYDETQFPNTMGQKSQVEATETLDPLWTALREAGCPLESFQHTCLLAAPPCESSGVPLVPCKELCIAAVAGCLEVASNLGLGGPPLSESTCADLPSEGSGDCLDRTIHSFPVEGDLRLMDGGSSNRGRVEVFLNGRWGTVCRAGFNFSPDGDVLCGQLGFDSLSALWYTGIPGDSSISSHMSYIDCDGSESRLVECSYSRAGCPHSQDLFIDCD